MLTALDIETCCNVDGCIGFNGSYKCKHALDPNRSRITLIGLWNPELSHCFHSVEHFEGYLNVAPHDFRFIAQNGKFDFKHLAAHGLDIRDMWVSDSLLLASVMTEKVSEKFIADYEKQRVILNKALPPGATHRKASKHSLKVMAPFFLGIEPFWEDPTNHDNVEYCLKDCEYTYNLYHKLLDVADPKEIKFYRENLFPWTKMLLDSEYRGIEIDLPLMDKKHIKAAERMVENQKSLVEGWSNGLSMYGETKLKAIDSNYKKMFIRALNKAKDKEKCIVHYNALQSTAYGKLQDLNLNSPKQLGWLLKDFLGYDIRNFKGKESTGVEVLENLAGQGKKYIPELLKFKKDRKLCTAFFPSYAKLQFNGVIHGNFNPTGTITGRLSSSGPNLQQIPGDLHELYRAREGKKLITYDLSAIEPRLIAYYTDCPVLFKIFDEGLDFHGINTKIFFNLDCDVADIKRLHPEKRKIGKEIGLALFYGAGGRRIQQVALKHGYLWSTLECREKAEFFRSNYKVVFEFKQHWDHFLEHKKFMLNLFGRPVSIPDKNKIYMTGFNTLIQGSASDLLMNSAHEETKEFRKRGIDAYPLLYVHDELVTECPADMSDMCAEIQRHCMTDYNLVNKHGRIAITVEGKVGDVWEK